MEIVRPTDAGHLSKHKVHLKQSSWITHPEDSVTDIVCMCLHHVLISGGRHPVQFIIATFREAAKTAKKRLKTLRMQPLHGQNPQTLGLLKVGFRAPVACSYATTARKEGTGCPRQPLNRIAVPPILVLARVSSRPLCRARSSVRLVDCRCLSPFGFLEHLPCSILQPCKC